MRLTTEEIAQYRVEPGWNIGIELSPRWGDIDAFGHVNHRTHLQWCEEARNAYFRSLGIARFTADQPGPVIRELGFSYEESLTLGEDVLVTSRVVWLRKSSFRMEYGVWHHGLVGRGFALCIWYNSAAKKTSELTGELRMLILDLDRAEDRLIA